MWHCVSVDIKILPKRMVVCFFKASVHLIEESVLSPFLVTCLQVLNLFLFKKLLWIVPVKINIPPCPD